MTVVTPTRPAGVGPCAVGAPLSCSSVSVFRWREQGKTCTHMWDVMRREGPGSVLFSTDGIQGRGGRVAGGLRKGVCVCVVCCVRLGAAGGPAAVSSSSVCQQVNSPSIPAASRTSAKMTGHAPLFTHSRSLSICSSTAADSFCFSFLVPPHLCAFSVWSALSHFCFPESLWLATQLWFLLAHIFSWFKDSDLTESISLIV